MAPDFATVLAAERANRAALSTSRAHVAGVPLPIFRRAARLELLGLAQAWSLRITGVEPSLPPPDAPLFAGGHQPELFHPGVWIKNFAIGQLATSAHGAALNLIVDSDLLPATELRVPAGSLTSPHLDRVPFAAGEPLAPWEETRVHDPELLASFGDRTAHALAPWGITPLLKDDWPTAISPAPPERLFEAFARLRIHRERTWGLQHFELPMSWFCESLAFRQFAACALSQAESFRFAYNSVVQEYRAINRLRSRSHPVPDLAERDGWSETPFWVWRTGATQRERLFVRHTQGMLELRIRDEVVDAWPCHGPGSCEKAVAALGQWSARGLKLRTRALTTTLFVRLCVADLFVHGIGGAKYDEMTDQLFPELFGIPAPALATVTGTLHLPLGADRHSVDLGQLQHKLRDSRQNPDRHADHIDPAAAELLAEKRQLIAEQQASQSGRQSLDRSSGRARLRRFRELKAELATISVDAASRLEQQIADTAHVSAADRILFSREFSAWLFPRNVLEEFLRRPFHADR